MPKYGLLYIGLLVVSPIAVAEWEPFLFVDTVAYTDTEGGKAGAYSHEALGLYNVHHDHNGHAHGTLERGVQVRTLEASVHWHGATNWDGTLKAAYSPDAGKGELEEAWLRYRPAAKVAVKAGKLPSAISEYNLHPHEWRFGQQDLPTQMLLDGGLAEEGVQVEWQPQLGSTRLRMGLEWLDGGNLGVAAREDSVQGYRSSQGRTFNINYPKHPDFPQVGVAYLKAKHALDSQQSLHGGVSYLKSRQHQELHRYHPGINNADHGLTGKAAMWGVEAGYRRAGNAATGVGGLQLLASYLHQNKDMELVFHELQPQLARHQRDLHVDGYSLEGTYAFAPRWQLGLRHERVGGTHEARRAGPKSPPFPTGNFPTHTSQFDDMRRNTLALTWQPAKQHRVRIEAARNKVGIGEDTNGDGRDEAVTKRYNQFMLQYQWSLDGGHGHTH